MSRADRIDAIDALIGEAVQSNNPAFGRALVRLATYCESRHVVHIESLVDTELAVAEDIVRRELGKDLS